MRRPLTSLMVVALAAAFAHHAGADDPPAGPATASAPTTTTATAPAERLVEWREYKAATEEAGKRKALLLAVYFDPDAPAWEALEEHVLRHIDTRRFLGQFAACRIDVTTAEGKKLFKATGAKETPLTQVLTPAGELLDSIPGAIIPAGEFRNRLQHSLACWKAMAEGPPGPAAQWKAIQARLRLSTCEKTLPAIEKLMKLPAERLPTGVTAAHLYLARGRALFAAAPKKAEKDLQEALRLASKNRTLGQYIGVTMIQLALKAKEYKKAHAYCLEYIRDFPKSPSIGGVYYYKAMVEMTGLDDRDAAMKTLEEFIRAYPDDPGTVRAQRLLTWLKDTRKK